MNNSTTNQKPTPALGNNNAATVDPETILRIKNLDLRAKLVVEGFMSGLHRSPYQGFSVEFTDYRQYSPGDDLRYLDWKLYARADRHYIKRFEDETNLRCYLIVDQSRSMNFGTLSYTKLAYAQTLAATLAYFFSLQRDATGLLTFDERVNDYIPPKFRPGHLRRIMAALERPGSGNSTQLAEPLEEIARTVNKRGMIILISDLLAPTEPFSKSLAFLRARGHDVMILRVLDPRDVDFEFDSATMFEDIESGKQIYVDPATAKSDYQTKFSEHRDEIKKTCDQLGVDYFEIQTDQAMESALFDVIQARSRMGRQVRRASAGGIR